LKTNRVNSSLICIGMRLSPYHDRLPRGASSSWVSFQAKRKLAETCTNRLSMTSTALLRVTSAREWARSICSTFWALSKALRSPSE
jgi:hypothetical protein